MKKLTLVLLSSVLTSCLNATTNDLVVRKALSGEIIPRGTVTFIRINVLGRMESDVDLSSLAPGLQNRVFAFTATRVAKVIVSDQQIGLVDFTNPELTQVIDNAFREVLDADLLNCLLGFWERCFFPAVIGESTSIHTSFQLRYGYEQLDQLCLYTACDFMNLLLRRVQERLHGLESGFTASASGRTVDVTYSANWLLLE